MRLGEPERADDPRVLVAIVAVVLVARDAAGGLHPQSALDRLHELLRARVGRLEDAQLDREERRGVDRVLHGVDALPEAAQLLAPKVLEHRLAHRLRRLAPAAARLAQLLADALGAFEPVDDRRDAVRVHGLLLFPQVVAGQRQAAGIDEGFEEVRGALDQRPKLQEHVEVAVALEVVPHGRDDARGLVDLDEGGQVPRAAHGAVDDHRYARLRIDRKIFDGDVVVPDDQLCSLAAEFQILRRSADR